MQKNNEKGKKEKLFRCCRNCEFTHRLIAWYVHIYRCVVNGKGKHVIIRDVDNHSCCYYMQKREEQSGENVFDMRIGE